MRAIGALSAALLASAASAQAQVAGGGCPAEQTVGSLGVSLIECDCVIAPAVSNTPWQFWTEPRVLRIERGSAASERLQVGDVITHVDGLRVTTAAGARALARVQPNRTVTLRIRRGEQTLEQSMRSTPVCPHDPVLLGATRAVVPPSLAGGQSRAEVEARRAAAAQNAATGVATSGAVITTVTAEGVTVTPAKPEAVTATTVRPGGGAAAGPRPAGARARGAGGGAVTGAVTAAPTQQGPASAVTGGRALVSAARPQATYAMSTVPSGWVGIAFSCTDCVYTRGQSPEAAGRWTFRTPPAVYSVEQGSPAYAAGMRRGDVLTHVDDHAITSEQGGRRWAQIRPGERVRLRYRRGSTTRYATVQAATPPGIAVTTVRPGQAPLHLQRLQATVAYVDSASTLSLRAAERSQQERTRREQTQQKLIEAQQQALRQLTATLQEPQTPESRRRVDELLRALARDQAQLAQQQQREVEELLRANRLQTDRMLASRDSVERAVTALSGAYARSANAEQRLRYSGDFNGTDVEVRSVMPVVVTETATEIIIRAGDTVVTLKRTRE